MVKIEGIISPIVTPFHDDESINYDELKNQINRLISNGIHGIFAFGTNGEGYILSYEEKIDIMKTVVKEVDGRVPVYASTGCISTKETIELSLEAEKIGVDVLSIITPWFAVASQEELYEHYRRIAENVNLPIMLYNIPARTGNEITPDTLERLSSIQNIIGIKDSSGDFDNILQFIERTREDKSFTVLSGNDSLIYWTLLAGGSGGIAGCSNVYPYTLSQIYDQYIQGKHQKAREYQDSIRSFRDCFKYGNPNTIVKYATKKIGNPIGNCRAPFNLLSDEAKSEINKVLEKNETIGMK